MGPRGIRISRLVFTAPIGASLALIIYWVYLTSGPELATVSAIIGSLMILWVLLLADAYRPDGTRAEQVDLGGDGGDMDGMLQRYRKS